MNLRKLICFACICFILLPALSYSELLEMDSPPQNFAAISGEIRAVPLVWSIHPSTRILGYVIYRSDSKGEDFREIAKLTSRYITSYLDGKDVDSSPFKMFDRRGKLLDNKNYYYRIAAITGENSLGKFSEFVKATTASRPTPPLAFKAFSGGAKVVPLNWMPPQDKTVIGYRIYRKDSMEGELRPIKDISRRIILSYLDKGKLTKPLESEKNYYYAISSLNQANVESYITHIASAKTKIIPPEIKDISASKGKVKSIKVSWGPSPIPDLKHYVITKKRVDSSESQKEIKIQPDKTFYFDENLPDSARYHYQVKAVDVEGLKGESTLVASGTTKNIPSAPKNIKISHSDNKIIIKWNKNPEPDIMKYEVYKIKGLLGIMKKLGIVKNNSFTDHDFKKGEKVSYRIVAVDADNLMSKKSDIISYQILE